MSLNPLGLNQGLSNQGKETGFDGRRALERLFMGAVPASRQFDSLALESSTPLFYSDLFNYANELDSQGDSQTAARIYESLMVEAEASSALRERARTLYRAIHGDGPLGPRMERGSRFFMEEVTSPELILGMGAGSLGFGIGRLTGLHLARYSGLRGRASIVLGRGMGLGTEAAGFTLASRSIGILRGTVSGGLWEGFPQHFASAALMVGLLRGAGWTAQGLLGPVTFPMGHWRHALHQSTRFSAMYLGLLSNAGIHQYLGWGPHRTWDQMLSDSGAQMVTFLAAGQVSRHLLGPSLHPIASTLEGQAARIEQLNLLTTGPTHLRLAWVGGRQDMNSPHVYNMGDSNGRNGNKSRRPVTSEVALPGSEVHGSRLLGNHRVASDVLALIRQVLRDGSFPEQVLRGDVILTIEGYFNLKNQISLTNLIKAINKSTEGIRHHPENLEFLASQSRKVTLKLAPGAGRSREIQIEISLKEGQFQLDSHAVGNESVSEPPPPLLGTRKTSLIAPEPESDHIARGRSASAERATQEMSVVSRQIWTWDHLPVFVDSLMHLHFNLKDILTRPDGSYPTLILGDSPIDPVKLNQASASLRHQWSDGRAARLLAPKNALGERTIFLYVKGEGLRWEYGRDRGWDWAERQAAFEQSIVRNPTSLYQLMEALSRRTNDQLSDQIVLKHLGHLSNEYATGLGMLTVRSLSDFNIPTRKFRITDSHDRTIISAIPGEGRWKMAEIRRDLPSEAELLGSEDAG